MKNIWVIIIALLSLLSCNDSKNNASSHPNADSALTLSCQQATTPDAIEKNSIIVNIKNGETGLAMDNIIVQLGHESNSDALMRSDITGRVYFKNLNSERHQVHVFGPIGYNWVSYFQIDASNGCDFDAILTDSIIPQAQPPESIVNSQATITGSINNIATDSNIRLVYYADQFSLTTEFFANQKPIANYQFKVDFNEAAGFNVNAEIWALEYQTDAINGDSYLSDLSYIPRFNFNTINTNNTVNITIQNIQFKSQTERYDNPLLAQFDVIEWPSDLIFRSFEINSALRPLNNWDVNLAGINLYKKTQNNFMASPSFYSYLSPNLLLARSKIVLRAKNNKNNLFWNYSKSITFGKKNLAITPKIRIFPKQQASPLDAQISWSATNVQLRFQKLFIQNLPDGNYADWDITILDNSSQLLLPKHPTEVVAMLTPDTQYQVVIYGDYLYSETHNTKNTVQENFTKYILWRR